MSDTDAEIAELQIRAQVAERACGELRAELEKMQAELADWKEAARIAAEEPCEDERHCTCVPLLRTTVTQRDAQLAAQESSLNELLDGLDANADETGGLSQQQWDMLVDRARQVALDLDKESADHECRIRANERMMTLALIRQMYHELDADGFARKMCEIGEGRA